MRRCTSAAPAKTSSPPSSSPAFMMASFARSTNSYARSSKRICSKMWRAPQAPKLSALLALTIWSFWLVGVGVTDPKSSANRWAKGRSACSMCLDNQALHLPKYLRTVAQFRRVFASPPWKSPPISLHLSDPWNWNKPMPLWPNLRCKLCKFHLHFIRDCTSIFWTLTQITSGQGPRTVY